MVRAFPLAVIALVFFPNSLFAGDTTQHRLPDLIVKLKIGKTNSKHETYRGYFSDLSAIADRKDASELVDGLRRQIDIVESAGLSSRVLQFFRTMPIVIDDFACLGGMTASTSSEPKPITEAACYSMRVPES